MADLGADRVRELFDACLDLQDQERLQYLEQACDDADVRARVERLLEAHQQAQESPTISFQGRDAGPSVPGSIGPYKIVQILGEGGMGIVYEAEQRQPVRRRVALKIVRAGMDTKEIVTRFEAERQALAVMDHPYIAKVLDAGVTEDGRPFFVMDLVKGAPLLAYCDQHNLTTRQRLELFIELCHAVQHAHQKGVIHRDLKPSNVLVSVDGETPVPKVIDFGIAKAIGQQLTENTLVTLHGQAIGTPAYMSPEQAGMSGLDVDTRTDVYSLGVILYELLVGALPIDPNVIGVPEFLGRLARLETDPPVPSSKLDSLGEGKTGVANRRTTDPGTLRKELRGDLDWVAMKAIERDRARRYATVNALSEEIRRYLRGEPVLARPYSATYRIAKFVHRNRTWVAAACLVFLALLAGGVTATIGFVRATRAQSEARLEAETARQVADFLVGLFAVADPGESRGETITARELLDRGTTRIRTELRDQPAVRARVLETMSRVHRSLGLYEQAGKLGAEALELRRTGEGAEPLEIAESLGTLGVAYAELGRFDEARSALEEALEIRRESLGEEHALVANSINDLASLEWNLDHFEQALTLNNRALAVREKVLGTDHVDVAQSLRGIGHVYVQTGDNEKALAAYERAQRILERSRGQDHPEVANNLDSLGIAYANLERYVEARAAHERAFQIRLRVLGEDHPSVAYSLWNLGRLHVSEGNHNEAVPLYERGIEIREAALGPDHPRTAGLVESLAIAKAMMGDLDGAQPLFQRALRSYQKSYARENYEVFECHRNLAILRAMKGDTRAALDHLQEAFASGHIEDMRLDEPAFQKLLKDNPEFQELERQVASRLKAKDTEAR